LGTNHLDSLARDIRLSWYFSIMGSSRQTIHPTTVNVMQIVLQHVVKESERQIWKCYVLWVWYVHLAVFLLLLDQLSLIQRSKTCLRLHVIPL
jgi:hypothetical protein